MTVKGFSLIELMIAVAILAIITGIAIPLYSGYIKESKLGAARANVEPLRTALEDYWLDNGTYTDDASTATRDEVWEPNGTKTLESGTLGWKPEGDNDKFIYVVAASASSYTITVNYLDLPDAGDAVTFHKG